MPVLFSYPQTSLHSTQHRKAKGDPVISARLKKVVDHQFLPLNSCSPSEPHLPPHDLYFYIVQDLSVGPWEGAAGPTVGFVFGRTAGFGLRAGGFSWTPILGATIGLKVLIVSLEELVLLRI